MHLRRDRNPYVTQALARGSGALPPKQKRSAFDSRRERRLPRESAGVDIRLSSGGDGIETHTRRYGSERRSRNGFQIRLRRFTALRASRCSSTVALTVLRPARWTSYSSRANPSRPATGSDAEGCCFALQAERLGALPSDSTECWLPWDGAHLGMMLRAGSTPEASSLRVRCNWRHCGLPNRRIRIVPGHSHRLQAPEMFRQHA